MKEPKVNTIKIRKSCGVKVSYDYQTYSFDASVELESNDTDEKSIQALESKAAEMAQNSVWQDIQFTKETDHVFATILECRNIQIEKLQENL